MIPAVRIPAVSKSLLLTLEQALNVPVYIIYATGGKVSNSSARIFRRHTRQAVMAAPSGAFVKLSLSKMAQCAGLPAAPAPAPVPAAPAPGAAPAPVIPPPPPAGSDVKRNFFGRSSAASMLAKDRHDTALAKCAGLWKVNWLGSGVGATAAPERAHGSYDTWPVGFTGAQACKVSMASSRCVSVLALPPPPLHAKKGSKNGQAGGCKTLPCSATVEASRIVQCAWNAAGADPAVSVAPVKEHITAANALSPPCCSSFSNLFCSPSARSATSSGRWRRWASALSWRCSSRCCGPTRSARRPRRWRSWPSHPDRPRSRWRAVFINAH